MSSLSRLVFSCLLVLAEWGPAPWRAPAVDLTVTTLGDTNDAGDCATLVPASLPGPGGVTSLREAICAANNNPGPETIRFGIGAVGVWTISPTSPLPALSGGGTTIDGYTQLGAAPADDASPAAIMIVLDGSLAGALVNGLEITSAGNAVRGLTINHFGGHGIVIAYATAQKNVVSGNHIGVNSSSTAAVPNGGAGVFIGLGAYDNVIGGETTAARNVLSGNGWAGVAIHGGATYSNVVTGNYLGLGGSGDVDLGNTLDGVWVYGGAHDNVIGGVALKRNYISGNERDGVRIMGAGTNGNVVYHNFIGTDGLGAADRGNTLAGVYIADGAQGNHIGGQTLSTYNVISGNGSAGVILSGTNTLSNTVAFNFIGLADNGTALIGNDGPGVYLAGGARLNLIGGAAGAISNVISGNTIGIHLAGAATVSNTIQNNYIGLDGFGVVDRGNQLDGVRLSLGVHGNLIGGDTAGERNVISGNNAAGVNFDGAYLNTLSGNYIGLNGAGTASLANSAEGVVLRNLAAHNLIGGFTAGERNIISGNLEGVGLYHALQNYVYGNYIGPDPAGLTTLGNFYRGVYLADGAQYNVIGSVAPGGRNVIAGNGYAGVDLEDAETTTNVVVGNYIGVDASGLAALGNDSYGVQIWNAARNGVGYNVIAGNGHGSSGGAAGVVLGGSDTTGNLIVANYIGLDATGAGALGNAHYGVWLRDGAHGNVIGGAQPGLGNAIAANTLVGVQLEGHATTANVVAGNFIGLNAAGTAPVFGTIHGVILEDGAHGNLIGGALPAARNVIAGHGNYGIGLWDAGTQENVLQGNFIGVLADGEQGVDGSQFGVYIGDGAQANQVIGGHLAHASQDGVLIYGVGTTGNIVSAVCVHDNDALGIHLQAGGNGGVPVPVLAAADLTAGALVITGTACPNCEVEVFASATNDGEGYWYLGTARATAGGSFSLTLHWLPAQYLTATARHNALGTSQFSAVLEAHAWLLLVPLVMR